MPKITALLHTHNDALRLGRTLDSLRPCDEVLVIDDCSEDDTSRVAREHGATLKTSIPGVTFGAYAADASHDWVLCLHPNETLSDDLEAALFDWKSREPAETWQATECRFVNRRTRAGKFARLKHGWSIAGW